MLPGEVRVFVNFSPDTRSWEFFAVGRGYSPNAGGVIDMRLSPSGEWVEDDTTDGMRLDPFLRLPHSVGASFSQQLLDGLYKEGVRPSKTIATEKEISEAKDSTIAAHTAHIAALTGILDRVLPSAVRGPVKGGS